MSVGRYQAYPEYKDSGIAWLGDMPKTWELRKAKHLFERVQRPVRESDGIVTAFRDGQVTLRSNRREDGFTNAVKEIGYQGVRNGDLLVHAMDGFAGAIGVSDSDGKCSPVCAVCTPWDMSQIDIRYYGYLVRQLAVTDYITSLAKGIRERSTEFRFSEFSGLELALPTKCEQTQIAAFLDHETAKIDRLIEKQQALISLLKEKRQAVISQAVTKGLNPHAPLRDSGIEWLGQVPAHWEISKFGYISSVVRGGSPRPAGDPTLFNGDYSPWVTVAEITKDDEVYLTQTETFLTKKGSDQCRIFASGTLVLSNSGATLGVPKILRIDANANDGVVGFEKLTLNHEYAYHYLSTLTDDIRERTKQGSGQPNLNTDIVKTIAIPIPPDAEAEQIVAEISRLRQRFTDLMDQATAGITLLQERRTALISAAVTGKIDVRHWQPPHSTFAA